MSKHRPTDEERVMELIGETAYAPHGRYTLAAAIELGQQMMPEHMREFGEEGRFFALIRERLAYGRGAIGPLDLATDQRDWKREAMEEIVDACVYLACGELAGKR